MLSQLLNKSRFKILHLLRLSSRTVNELAAALGLTDNGIRLQLERLERDGLVRQTGTRPAFRKPESVYDVTPEAEQLFTKAYLPVIASLLAVLKERLTPQQQQTWLQEMGQKMAAPYLPQLQKLPARQRAQASLKILSELGGVAQLQGDEKTGYHIRGLCCPVANAVAQHPEICTAVESLVSELLGTPVRQYCDHGDRPKCNFQVLAGRD